MTVIKVNNVTKDYGFGRGVFNVSFEIKKGEVFGYLGPNGAGKTTTIRQLMGFSKADQGYLSILGLDSRKDSSEILKKVGYLPGEIALYEHLSILEFLDYMAKLRGVEDLTYMNELINYFEFDTKGRIKRMSLGNKRKLAIVTAFMHDPEILLLDEPTSGLDPLMQEKFTEFILKEKARGKTILLSSHIFSEVDATCDRIAIIKDGHIVSEVETKFFKHNENKSFKIEFNDKVSFDDFKNKTKFELVRIQADDNQVIAAVHDNDINELFKSLKNLDVKFISEIKFTLEDYFLDFYDRKKDVKEGMTGVIHRD